MSKYAIGIYIESEREIVEGNRELIRIAAREAKIKQVIPLQGRCEKVLEG